MSDDLVKLGWKIRSEELAEVDTPFGSYGVKDYAENGWRWFYCFDTYFDNDVLPCEDMAHGMSLAEEHWRDRVQPITKPLTDRIKELTNCVAVLEADLRKMALDLIAADGQSQEAYQAKLVAEAKLEKAVEALQGLVPILCEGFEDGCGKLSRHDCAACEGYATLAELSSVSCANTTGGKDE